MGGNVRVGLEDSLWIGAGKLAQSNADQRFEDYLKDLAWRSRRPTRRGKS